MAEHGGPADWRHSDAFRRASRAEALEGRWDADLWVFAYGSLLWDPAFHFTEVRAATVHGHHRALCLRTTLGRGNPEQPGLMAGLSPGGSCAGFAFRIDRAVLDHETWVLWRREFLLPAYLPAFVRAETAGGPLDALTCLVDPSIPDYLPDLDREAAARLVATGCGVLGTSFDYARCLHENLAAVGLVDEDLSDLLDRAERLRAEEGP
ncbi:MAG: gamma-glutamylcyclotransferase [Alphaproteobacteria bacterium]|nr:gamma-glutamylcyclotransferase [Alphaproteobacteria bacterium]